MASKKDLSERDICSQYILPALVKAGWDLESQIREEVYFTDGRIFVTGNRSRRGKRKFADFILYYKPNIPVAIIEAKKNTFSVDKGIAQGIDYADILDIPVVFSSNGDGFYEHDKSLSNGKLEQEIDLDAFPSPSELWERYKKYKNISAKEEKTVLQEYYHDRGGRTPRYYQQIAINRSVEAIAKGQKRLLLVMATGTGKTYTAFQIIHRLWRSKTKKRILFLADRNALIDQTKKGDFRHFKDKMTVIRKKKIDKSYEIYLALYQGLTNYDEDSDAYRQFSRDFFDLIVIDEAHRGSASNSSAWREILDYFTSATQIGLTATPKETKEVSNIEYFGDPIYTYTLKEGIEDGFLAPYKVMRIGLNVDLEGWRPEKGKVDKDGVTVSDREYNIKDYDRSLVIDERTQKVAKKVTEYLKATDRYAKTIIFCVDIDHAKRMRNALVNLNADLVLENSTYVMQITGDNAQGKMELDNFIDPEISHPVIATTSKLMTTGVDAQTCKLIVLDSNINSITEFKQIIGRGTRINEAYNKYFFTIMDFRNATHHFADEKFDGEAIQIKELSENEPIEIDDKSETNEEEEHYTPTIKEAGVVEEEFDGYEKKRKVYVNGVNVTLLNERIQYLDNGGKLITGSLKDYTKTQVQKEFASLDDFLNSWNSAKRKELIIEELAEKNIIYENLKDEIGKDMDVFDMICHCAFDMPPLSRKERANRVIKRDYFSKYQDKTRAVLEALLTKYADEGIENIEKIEVLRLPTFKPFGSPIQIVKYFGGKQNYIRAVAELEDELYRVA